MDCRCSVVFRFRSQNQFPFLLQLSQDYFLHVIQVTPFRGLAREASKQQGRDLQGARVLGELEHAAQDAVQVLVHEELFQGRGSFIDGEGLQGSGLRHIYIVVPVGCHDVGLWLSGNLYNKVS